MIIKTISNNSFSMEYLKFGHGKKTLLIIPGLSIQSVIASADAIEEAYMPLADEFTIFLFDRRKELPKQYSVHDMARDTTEVINALGLRDIYILGASQGGAIAMYITADQPELVRKLILASTTAIVTEEQFGIFSDWIILAKAGKREELYLSFGKLVYPEEVFEQFKEFFIKAAKSVSDKELERFVIMAESMKNLDITAELEKIRCPVLVIGSNDDKVLGPVPSRIISEHLNPSRTELYMYNDFGHAIYDTAPDFKKRILNYLCEE